MLARNVRCNYIYRTCKNINHKTVNAKGPQ